MFLVPTLLALALQQTPAASPAAAPAAAVVEPGANLKLDGIPAIPKAFAAGVRRYTESRSARFQDWHPTKRELVISTRFGEAQQLHLVRAPGGAREQLTYFPGPVGNRDDDAASYTQDGRALVVYADNDGDEQYQLQRLELKTGALALLTDGKSRNGTPVWTEQRDRFAYTSTRRNGKDFDLYLGTADAGTEAKRLLEVQGQWYPVAFSPDAKTLAVVNYLSANESHLYLVDVASGTKRHLTEGMKVRVDGVQFARDGKSLFVLCDRGSEFIQLHRLDPAALSWRSLTPDLKWDVEELALSPDGKTLAYAVNEDGFSRLYLMDARSGRARRIEGVPNGVLFGLSWHKNSRDLGFTVSAHDVPGDVFSLDAPSGKVTQWTFSEVGPIDRTALSAPEAITWKGHDGMTLHGVLYRPPAKFKGPRPVLLAHRGGPESQSRPTFLGTTNYYLNELGIAVIYLNLRGQPGYGKTYLAADDGLKRDDAYRDIGSLLDWVAQRPELDKERVIFSGGSYGGHLALMSAYLYADRLIATIDNVGISSFLTFLTNTAEYRRDLRRVEYGDERVPEIRAWMEKNAPLHNTAKMKDPMLVIQGRNDPRVPISEADQIVKQVRQNGVPVWYLVADDEGHGFFKKSNVEVQLYVTAQFLQKLLEGGPEALRAPERR